jgi:hypothetical protein
MKIYIHVIEGTGTWMPARVTELGQGQFEVVDFEEFDPKDHSIIPQFIVGDIVTLRTQVGGEGEFLVADKLIKPSAREDKKYFEFLYRTVTDDKLKGSVERYQFRHIIKRIRDEIQNGDDTYYPAVVNYVKGVETKRK